MNKRQLLIVISAICLPLIITACGTTSGQPMLEKNAYYQKVGSEQAELDIEQAISSAKNKLNLLQQARKDDLETTVKKSAISSGTGTVTALITGRAALGVVTGSGPETYSRMQQKKEDKIYFREDVEKHLREKGYQIKYWK